jgi:hypothetical protein
MAIIFQGQSANNVADHADVDRTDPALTMFFCLVVSITQTLT